jgi:predicted peptidase
MKPVILIILFFFVITGSFVYIFRPNYSKIKKKIQTTSCKFKTVTFERELLYRLYKPTIKSSTLYPLIVNLHGAAERGKDNLSQIDEMASTLISGTIQRKHPAFVFIPQCPEGTQWVNTGFIKTPFGHYQQSSIPESPEMKMIIAVITELITQYPIDKSRIYVSGFSMGGSGTWDIISRHPDLFAAALVMSGVSDTSTAEKIKKVPVWAFTGEFDDIAPPQLNKEMCEAVLKSGGNCKYTLYSKTGHNCVNHVLNEPGVLEWLFSQKRKLQ